MNLPKVSVLIPVYNVSDFIEQCAHSLFLQTFQDIEFIFVNDCTPEDSMEKLYNVLLQYPHLKNKIKIIHHSSNRGSAAARNTAIDASTGNYISFIDSDDYIEPNMIEELYNKALLEDADIVVSDFMLEYPNKTIYISDLIGERKEDNFALIIKQDQTYSCLWNKLIRRELYERSDCRVQEGLNYSEDRHIMTRLYYFADKIVKVDQAFYHYVQYNTNAITKTKNRMHFENLVLFWNLLDTFLISHNTYENYKNEIEFSKVEGKVRLMIDTNSYKLRKEYSNIFQEEEINFISLFRKGERCIMWLLRNNFFLLAHIFRSLLVLKNRGK